MSLACLECVLVVVWWLPALRNIVCGEMDYGFTEWSGLHSTFLQVTSCWRASVSEGRACCSCSGHHGCFPGTRDLGSSNSISAPTFFSCDLQNGDARWNWTSRALQDDLYVLDLTNDKFKWHRLGWLKTPCFFLPCAFLFILFVGLRSDILFLWHLLQGCCSRGRAWSSLWSLHGFGSSTVSCYCLRKWRLAPICTTPLKCISAIITMTSHLFLEGHFIWPVTLF